MSSADKVEPPNPARAGEKFADAAEGARLAEAAMALLRCHSADDVYDAIGAFLTRLLPGAVVIISEGTLDLDALVSRRILGLDDSLLGKTAGILGFDLVGTPWDMLPAHRAEVLSGELTKLEDGLTGLMSRETSRTWAAAAAKLFGGRDVYTVGIADGEQALGCICMLASPSAPVPIHTIESFAHHCYSALSVIRRTEDLAQSAERSRTLFEKAPLGYQSLDEDGSFRQTHCILTDVTECRQAKEALEKSREMIVNLTSMVPGVVYQYRLNPDGSSAFPFASTGINEIYEVTAEEVREDATPVFGRLHPEDAERVSELIFESARTLKPFRCEFRVILPRQGLRWRLSDAMPQRTEDGGTLWHGIISDITERKRIEHELTRQVGLFETAIGNLPVGVFMVEAVSGRPLVANDQARKILGRGILPDANEQNLAHVYRAFRAGTDEPYPAEEMPIVQGIHGQSLRIDDMEVERPDGTRALLEVIGTPVVDENGSPWASLVGFLDITERKRAEEEIMRLNEELERRVQERTEELSASNEELTAANEELFETNALLAEATAAKSDFLASMSHELRTPLNSIIGFSGLLLEGLTGPLSDQQRQQIGIVNTSGRHLLALVDDILDLAKIEAGRVTSECVEFKVADLVSQIMDMVSPMAEAKAIALECSVGPGAESLESDMRLIGQILTNLLCNAIKFTDVGTVSMAVVAEDRCVVFEVEDTGCGIPASDLSRISERFYQATPVTGAKSDGTGLGLAICRHLSMILGATIEVSSAVGVGSTFTLRVPRSPGRRAR